MVDDIPDYDELQLRVAPAARGGYHAVAFAPDGSTASSTFLLPFDEMELENFVLRVGRPRRGVRAYRSSQMEDAKRFGSTLFDALVTGDIRDIYVAARRVADQNNRGLRLTLYLTETPALTRVPWEFLYERPNFLAQSIFTPVVRSLDLKSVRLPQKVTLPLRILALVSRPDGFAALDVEQEREKLESAVAPLRDEGFVRLEWLDRATLSDLNDTMSRRGELHVLHYVGHGAYDARTESGILVLENQRGGPHEVTGEELGSLLQDKRSLRLVVLNSCEGARSSGVDPFSGVASSLLEYGISAGIGMQFEITDNAAITFAGRLYGALAQGYPVDAALAQARRAIFAAGHDIEFGTPVLYLRGSDARLFDLEHDSASRVPDSHRRESTTVSNPEPGPGAEPRDRLAEWQPIDGGALRALPRLCITILGGSGSGKTTYLHAAYAALSAGLDGYFLSATTRQVHERLGKGWTALVRKGIFPPPTETPSPTSMVFWDRSTPVVALEWLDYRGGAMMDRTTVSDTQTLLDRLPDSDSIYLTLDGALLAEGVAARDFLRTRRQAGARRMLSLFQNSAAMRERPPTLVILVTKADLIAAYFREPHAAQEGLIDAVRETLPIAFTDGVTALICPVSLGDLGTAQAERVDPAHVEPRWTHKPILFSIREAQVGKQRDVPSGVVARQSDLSQIKYRLADELEGLPIFVDGERVIR